MPTTVALLALLFTFCVVPTFDNNNVTFLFNFTRHGMTTRTEALWKWWQLIWEEKPTRSLSKPASWNKDPGLDSMINKICHNLSVWVSYSLFSVNYKLISCSCTHCDFVPRNPRTSSQQESCWLWPFKELLCHAVLQCAFLNWLFSFTLPLAVFRVFVSQHWLVTTSEKDCKLAGFSHK